MSNIRVELELADGQFISRALHAGETIKQFNENIIKTHPQLKKLEADLVAAGKEVNRFSDGNMVAFNSISKIEKRSRGFIGTLRDMTVILGLAHSALSNIQTVTTSWAGKIIQVNSEFERMNMLMRSMSNKIDPLKEAAENVKKMRDYARNTPFTLEAITDSFTKIKATGVDPLNIALGSLTDAVAAFGGNDDVFKRATLAVSQMSGKGVIQMEELRQQLGESIPRATELMARSMGLTYGQLVKEISTGTVVAKRALDQLYLELERTFGGSSQRMMRTFAGQIQQSQTLLQEFALKVGATGYFEVVKQQLVDFNNLLQSRAADVYAEKLGFALKSIVENVRALINWVIKYKEEIIDTAKIMAATWAAGRAFAAIGLMSTAIKGVIGNVKLLGAEIKAINFAGFATSATSALGVIGAGFSATAAAAGVLGTVLGIALPLLPLLGAGIYAVANYFDLFDKKGDNAVKTLREFTAASREELETAKELAAKKADALQKEVTDEQAALKKRYKNYENFVNQRRRQELYRLMPESDKKDFDEKLNQAWFGTDRLREVLQIRQDIIEANKEFEERMVREGAKARLEIIDESFSRIQREYDNEGKILADKHQKEREELKKAGKTTIELDDQYKAEQQRRAEKFNTDMIDAMQKRLLAEQLLMRTSNQEQIDISQRVSEELTKQINERYRLLEMTQQVGTGIEKTTKETNPDKLLDKAQKLLDRLTASARDYRAEMEGGQGEVAKLVYLLKEAQTMGDSSLPGLSNMIDRILEAQSEVSKLQELLRGKNAIERDTEALLAKEQDKLFEARYGHLSEIDKMIMKINLGIYKGQGPSYSPLEESIMNLKEQIRGSTDNIKTMGDSIAEAFSGTRTLNAVETFKQKLDELNGKYNAIKNSGFDSINSPIGKSYVDKLIGRESSGDSNAVPRDSNGNLLSTAQGLGQFIESTWMDFLNEMHPDILGSMSKKDALDLRKVDAFMMEAIDWITKKNAATLQSNGYKPTDDKLYLAHLLGSGDAINLFNAEDRTLLKDVIKKASIDSNPFMADKTVGWLKNWAITKFGQGTSGVDPLNKDVSKWMPSRLSTPINISDEARKNIIASKALEITRLQVEADNALSDARKDVARSTLEASEQTEEYGKREAALRKRIREGDFGKNIDPDSDRYKQLIADVKKLDDAEKALAETKKARTKADNFLNQQEAKAEELALRKREALAKIGDPNELKSSVAMRSYMTQLNNYVMAVENAYGRDSDAYKKAIAEKEAALRGFHNVEILEYVAQASEKNRQLENSLMTEKQRRDANLADEIAVLRKYMAEFRGTAEERLLVEETLTKRIMLLRQQAADSSPFRKQLKEWQDIQSNMEEATTSWLSSATDQLTDFIMTGKADFQDLANSIIRDILRISLRLMIANLITGGGKKGGMTSAKIAHTGGVVGSRELMTKQVSPYSFVGAEKYHSGGVVRQRLGLAKDEVPIIAKEGEGVFTKEQMKLIGKNKGNSFAQSITIAPSIQVNANGGTKEQNEDLAKQISGQIEPAMRQLVVDELMKQMRPGNILNG